MNKNTFYLFFKENAKPLKVPKYNVTVTIAL